DEGSSAPREAAPPHAVMAASLAHGGADTPAAAPQRAQARAPIDVAIRQRVCALRRSIVTVPGERLTAPTVHARLGSTMARKPVVLVTGASGEMGHGLIRRLAELADDDVLALDLRALDPELARCCAETRVGDVLDRRLLERLRSEFEISTVFHLAAL